MQSVVDQILVHKPLSISSYTLFLKRSSSFIPNFYGIAINRTDRALFLLDKIPNHRFIAQNTVRRLQKPRDEHAQAGTTPADFNYLLAKENTCHSCATFLVETVEGEKPACITYRENDIEVFKLGNPNSIMAEVLIIEQLNVLKDDNRTLSSGLVRWVESQARHMDKQYVLVSLLGVCNNAVWWEKQGYEKYKGRDKDGNALDDHVIKKIC